MESLELVELEELATDAGGPGEFRYDGGPKPYKSKKTGKPTPSAKKKIDSYNEGQQTEHQRKVQQAEQITQQAKAGRAQEKQIVESQRQQKKSVIGNETSIQSSDFENRVNSLVKQFRERNQERLDDIEKEFKEDKINKRIYEENKKYWELDEDLFLRKATEVAEFELGLNKERYRDPNIEDIKDNEFSYEELNSKFESSSSLSDSQLKELRSFTLGSDRWDDANDYIYKGDATGFSKAKISSLKKGISDLSKAVSSSKLKNDLTVFRGIAGNVDYSGSTEYIESLYNASPGDIIENKGFMSTTSNLEVASMFAKSNGKSYRTILVLNLSKGQNALFVDSTRGSSFPGQQEILLNKGSNFRVDSVNKENRIIHLTMFDKGEANDSVALDYTFISEEHPRKKDDFSWEGRPQQPSTHEQKVQQAEQITQQAKVNRQRPIPVQKSKNPRADFVGQVNEEFDKKFEPLWSKFRNKEISEKEFREEHNKLTQHKVTSISNFEKSFYRPEISDINQINEVKKTKEYQNALKERMEWYEEEYQKQGWNPDPQHFKNAAQSEVDKEFGFNYSPKFNEQPKEAFLDSFDDMFSYPELSDEQKKAIALYTRDSFDFNNYVVKHTKSSKKKENVINQITNLIDSSVLKQDATVYRGLSSYEDKENYLGNLLNSSKNDVIDTKAFVSCSMDPYMAIEFANLRNTPNQVLLSISLKKGQNAFYAHSYHAFGGQQEVLLQKQSKFKVESVDKENRTVHLTMLDSEKQATDSVPNEVQGICAACESGDCCYHKI